jgi:hypothetical protein
MRRSRFLCAILFLLLPAAAAIAQPVVTVASHRVTVTNCRAGARIVLWGVQLDGDDYQSGSTAITAILDDTDQDGTVTYVSTPQLERRAVWIAIDTATGDYATGAPARFAVSPPEHHGGFAKAESTTTNAVVPSSEVSYVLYWQPGNGAWRGITAGEDALAVSDLTAVDSTASGSPVQLVQGGKLFVVDGLRLNTDIQNITASTLNEVQ